MRVASSIANKARAELAVTSLQTIKHSSPGPPWRPQRRWVGTLGSIELPTG